MTLLFLYGTLKRGGSNHPELVGRFLGMARTVAGYTLYRLDGYPGMVPRTDDDVGVEGELWEVDDAALAHLDAFEGIEEGLYFRATVVLQAPYESLASQTYFYAGSVAGREHLGSRWDEQRTR